MVANSFDRVHIYNITVFYHQIRVSNTSSILFQDKVGILLADQQHLFFTFSLMLIFVLEMLLIDDMIILLVSRPVSLSPALSKHWLHIINTQLGLFTLNLHPSTLHNPQAVLTQLKASY